MKSAFDAKTRRALRDRLEAVDRIGQVLIDEDDGPVLWLVCDAEADRASVEAAAVEALRAAGVDEHAARVELLSRGIGGARQRARFEGVHRQRRPDGGARIRVDLEWRGKTYTGEASSDVGSGFVELRTAAAAAIDALEALIGRSLHLRLIGVKSIRAFDADFMVVSLYRTDEPTGHFVGSVNVSDDPLAAAVTAVLDAMNRILGNYLTTTDDD